MKFNILVAAIAATILITTVATKSLATTTVQGNATVSIQSQVGISESQQVDFGTIIPTSQAGSVTIADWLGNFARALPRNVTVNDFTAVKAGIFTVTGPASSTPQVTISSNATLNSGGNSMTFEPQLITARTQATDSDGNNGQFIIGGKLNVGANQPSGTYTGQYELSVDFQ